MPWGVDQVKCVVLIVEHIVHLNGVAFDSDAAFALKIHVVEHLVLHFLGTNGFGKFQQAVGKSTLAMIDVSYYTEVSNILHLLVYRKIIGVKSIDELEMN